MRFTAALLVAGASAAAAATTSAAASTPTDFSICAQNIVDACVEQYDKQVDACGGNDYICLCDNYTNKLTCYNNCMGSEDRPPVQNQVTQFCLAAEPQRSASSASLASVWKTAGTPSPAPTTSSASATGSSEATQTSADGFSTQKTGAAVPVEIPAFGGVVAAVFGLVGLL
ncbi:hypothetical protein DPSP01_006701 [Paraphaeosphaeria sporulosa]|uniref:Extracellular membrane protein CFEM domain-containing protein n=1 Tax=Paraphaeosphaeria sporulosa TaxID=1460663 RepID=A0A177CIR3_9PLEO|nr:uncharacterized protein CC84DRAFT_1258326 [Paraphaeosphaeria sporulosa]OAG07151.1 hypothetical protein CC84DRAFT_1258326 [Paraphaeosphaeria sporulosa]